MRITLMAITIFFLSSCGLLINEKATTVEIQDKQDVNCSFAFGLNKAISCASVAHDISCYNEEWPANTNSTLFFKLIEGNLKLTHLNFCFVHIDSLTSSIGKVPNLEYIQLSSGNISTIPKEIGELRKLKTLILGTGKDECGGNKIKKISKEIGKCESLEYLGLAFSVVDDLPKELENCKNLKTIDLSYNEVISDKKIEELKSRFPNTEIIVKK